MACLPVQILPCLQLQYLQYGLWDLRLPLDQKDMAYLLVQHSVRLPAEGLEEYKTVRNLSVLVHALGCHSSAIVRIWSRIRNRKDSPYHSEDIFYLPPPDVHVLLLAKLGQYHVYPHKYSGLPFGSTFCDTVHRIRGKPQCHHYL